MFIKVIGGRYFRLDKIEMLFISPRTPNEYWLYFVMNGEAFITHSYSTSENAEYAADFVMRLIENVNGDRLVVKLPTEQDVKVHKWADEIDKTMEEENG